jgi:hypothetical protein
VNKKFFEGMAQWASELKTQKFYINENMASFFHYKKHEFLSLSNLTNFKLKQGSGLAKKINDFTLKQ